MYCRFFIIAKSSLVKEIGREHLIEEFKESLKNDTYVKRKLRIKNKDIKAFDEDLKYEAKTFKNYLQNYMGCPIHIDEQTGIFAINELQKLAYKMLKIKKVRDCLDRMESGKDNFYDLKEVVDETIFFPRFCVMSCKQDISMIRDHSIAEILLSPQSPYNLKDNEEYTFLGTIFF